MTATITRRVVDVGDQAPDFVLPGLDPAKPVSLRDYRGASAVLLGLFRGLHCPFCRRQVALLGGMASELRKQGVAVVAVINTTPERARMYYGSRPSAAAFGFDPDWDTHRRYGLGRPEITNGPSDWPRQVNLTELAAIRSDFGGELPQPVSPMEANFVLNKREGFEMTETDQSMMEKHGMTGSGHFLIDRAGRVRWLQLEGEAGIQTLTQMPSREQILQAAQAA